MVQHQKQPYDSSVTWITKPDVLCVLISQITAAPDENIARWVLDTTAA